MSFSTTLAALKRNQRRVRKELVDAERVAESMAEGGAKTRTTNFNEVGWETGRAERASKLPGRFHPRGNG